MENQSAKERMIQDITNDDLRVQVKGYVNDFQGGDTFILKDSSGNIKVDLEALKVAFDFKEGDLVNVIGDLSIITSGEKIIEAEIIQDMNQLNFEYYQKIYGLKKEMLEKDTK